MTEPGVFPSILTRTYSDDATQPFWDAARAIASCRNVRAP